MNLIKINKPYRIWSKTQMSILLGLIGLRRDKTCLRGFATKRDSNQSPQPQRLASKLKPLKQV